MLQTITLSAGLMGVINKKEEDKMQINTIKSHKQIITEINIRIPINKKKNKHKTHSIRNAYM